MAQNIHQRIGFMKGIEGRENSCYIDASLMSLFFGTMGFEHFLPAQKDSSKAIGLSLRENLKAIVHSLRKDGLVKTGQVYNLREALATQNPRFRVEMMDVVDFISVLFKTLCSDRLIHYSPKGGAIFHQIIIPPTAGMGDFPSLSDLLLVSCRTQGVTIAGTQHPFFFVKMPRSNGKLVGNIKGIFPSLRIDVASQNMKLHAVITLRYCHYTAFIRVREEWVFFDSMAPGGGPEITFLQGFEKKLKRWHENAFQDVLNEEANEYCSPYLKRLICDGHVCLYSGFQLELDIPFTVQQVLKPSVPATLKTGISKPAAIAPVAKPAPPSHSVSSRPKPLRQPHLEFPTALINKGNTSNSGIAVVTHGISPPGRPTQPKPHFSRAVPVANSSTASGRTSVAVKGNRGLQRMPTPVPTSSLATTRAETNPNPRMRATTNTAFCKPPKDTIIYLELIGESGLKKFVRRVKQEITTFVEITADFILDEGFYPMDLNSTLNQRGPPSREELQLFERQGFHRGISRCTKNMALEATVFALFSNSRKLDSVIHRNMRTDVADCLVGVINSIRQPKYYCFDLLSNHMKNLLLAQVEGYNEGLDACGTIEIFFRKALRCDRFLLFNSREDFAHIITRCNENSLKECKLVDTSEGLFLKDLHQKRLTLQRDPKPVLVIGFVRGADDRINGCDVVVPSLTMNLANHREGLSQMQLFAIVCYSESKYKCYVKWDSEQRGVLKHSWAKFSTRQKIPSVTLLPMLQDLFLKCRNKVELFKILNKPNDMESREVLKIMTTLHACFYAVK